MHGDGVLGFFSIRLVIDDIGNFFYAYKRVLTFIYSHLS